MAKKLDTLPENFGNYGYLEQCESKEKAIQKKHFLNIKYTGLQQVVKKIDKWNEFCTAAKSKAYHLSQNRMIGNVCLVRLGFISEDILLL